MVATVLQVVGLVAGVFGAAMEWGVGGGVAAAGAALVYVGLALEAGER